MGKQGALIAIHGMGRAKESYACGLRKAIENGLGGKAEGVHFGTAYYEDILGPNQDRVWAAVAGRLRWRWLRKFALFFLADAGALESRKSEPDSAYVRIQIKIARELHRARAAVGARGWVAFVAHSLGCQVLSNYLWDAERYRKVGCSNVGIWMDPQRYANSIAGTKLLTDQELEFIRGDTVRYIFTTGCNIPMFVAGHDKEKIEAIRPVSDRFEWHNYFDPDDALGWPLGVLSESYGKLVWDHEVNAAGGLAGWVLASWNPLSHTRYWNEKSVLGHMQGLLGNVLREGR